MVRRKNEGPEKPGKGFFDIGFCKYSKSSFNYTFFQLLYKVYITVNSSKLPYFDNVMTLSQVKEYGVCYTPTHPVATSLGPILLSLQIIQNVYLLKIAGGPFRASKDWDSLGVILTPTHIIYATAWPVRDLKTVITTWRVIGSFYSKVLDSKILVVHNLYKLAEHTSLDFKLYCWLYCKEASLKPVGHLSWFWCACLSFQFVPVSYLCCSSTNQWFHFCSLKVRISAFVMQFSVLFRNLVAM